MKVSPDNLPAHVGRNLSGVYLISGDEPLQMGEMSDLVRNAARQQGFLGREVFQVESRFDWRPFEDAMVIQSLFDARRIIELRFSGKPDREASRCLRAALEKPPEDVMLILSMGRLTQDDQKSAWFKAVDAAGVVVQIWLPEGADFLRWLDRRMNARGLLVDQSSLKMLAARHEGNLLAAAQTIEMLYVVFGAGRLEDHHIADVVSNHARFDVFAFAESLLLGQIARSQRILQSLMAEGVASPVVLWAIARELRILARLRHETRQGSMPADALWASLRIWDRQRPRYQRALSRLDLHLVHELITLCHQTDLQIKGQLAGDPWLSLADIALRMTMPARSGQST